jgi:hypothetical protein
MGSSLGPRLVGWVPRVGWPAIKADVELVTVRFQLFLAGAVAMRAERLQVPEVEQLMITMVGRDVIRHRGRSDYPSRQTHSTQGMFSELQPGPTLPAPTVVQVMMATGLL